MHGRGSSSDGRRLELARELGPKWGKGIRFVLPMGRVCMSKGAGMHV